MATSVSGRYAGSQASAADTRVLASIPLRDPELSPEESRDREQMAERVEQLIAHAGGRAALIKATGLSQAYFSRLLTGLRDGTRKTINADSLSKIVEATGASEAWILRGDGPMLKSAPRDPFARVLAERAWPPFVIAAAREYRRSRPHLGEAEWRQLCEHWSKPPSRDGATPPPASSVVRPKRARRR